MDTACLRFHLADETGKPVLGLYLCFLTEENIPNADELANIFPADEIIMGGYPCGIADEKKFLIDSARFPGSSRSPVLLRDRTARLNGEKISFGNSISYLRRRLNSELDAGNATHTKSMHSSVSRT